MDLLHKPESMAHSTSSSGPEKLMQDLFHHPPLTETQTPLGYHHHLHTQEPTYLLKLEAPLNTPSKIQYSDPPLGPVSRHKDCAARLKKFPTISGDHKISSECGLPGSRSWWFLLCAT
ncbi:hypothetical protein BJX61DRAFT_17837 [Aspergillus egyptiacus]|nr:hypothetical protein BJX61DRAFT_17837 [Aspergillus egyptiacus]